MPFGLQAVDPSGAVEPVESLWATPLAAGASQVVNITPLTTAVAAGALTSGSPLDVLNGNRLKLVQAGDIGAAQTALQALLSDAGVVNGADFITTPFAANHTGLDQVLDEVRVMHVGNGVQVFNQLQALGGAQTAFFSKTSVGSGSAAASPFGLGLGSASVSAANFSTLISALVLPSAALHHPHQ